MEFKNGRILDFGNYDKSKILQDIRLLIYEGKTTPFIIEIFEYWRLEFNKDTANNTLLYMSTAFATRILDALI